MDGPSHHHASLPPTFKKRLLEKLGEIHLQGVNAFARDAQGAACLARIEELLRALTADMGYLTDDLEPVKGAAEIAMHGITGTRRLWIAIVRMCGPRVWHHRTWLGFAVGVIVQGAVMAVWMRHGR